MFRHKYKGILVAHENHLYWFTCRPGSKGPTGRCVLKMPLEHILGDEPVGEKLPKELRGNEKTLLVTPDHWFESAGYPFQSNKPKLIEPFLERKLLAAYPEKNAIRHLFNYRKVTASGNQNDLYAYFLQDSDALHLYAGLKRRNLAPRQISSPGFLWESKLAQAAAQFREKGTLLIHMSETMCLLYFYFNGMYLFSRSVLLSDAMEDLDAVNFEINQSQYMFSQKTKSDLEQLFVFGDFPEQAETLNQSLGRKVTDITAAIKKPNCLTFDEVPYLNGIIDHEDLYSPPSFFSLTHRQVKRELEWRPVQWAGILVGALLIFGLCGQHLFLSTLMEREQDEAVKIQRLKDEGGAWQLTEYEHILDHVLGRVERPTCAGAMHRLLSCLPEEVWIKDLDIAVHDPPTLQLNAAVKADNPAQFKNALALLAARIRKNFKRESTFSINDIDIRMDPSGKMQASFHYRISLKLNL